MRGLHLPSDPGWKMCDVRYTCGYPFPRVCPRYYAAGHFMMMDVPVVMKVAAQKPLQISIPGCIIQPIHSLDVLLYTQHTHPWWIGGTD